MLVKIYCNSSLNQQNPLQYTSALIIRSSTVVFWIYQILFNYITFDLDLNLG